MSYTGALVGLVTAPVNKSLKEFYNTEFYNENNGNGLFSGYRQDILKYSFDVKNDAKSLESLYLPKAYFVFGSYDLAILSLTDDFSLGNRHFNPLHQYKSDVSDKYKYELVSGIINDDQFATSTFNNNTKPWFSLIRLKINNLILVGQGIKLIKDIIKRICLHECKDLKIIPFYGFDNSEINLICFADSFSVISDFVTKVRDFNVEKLSKEIKVEIGNKSLIEFYHSNNEEDCALVNIDDNHIFTSTHSTIGVDLDYCKDSGFFLEEDIQLTTYFDVKPGHYSCLNNILQLNGISVVSSCFGDESLSVTTNCLKDKIPYFRLTEEGKDTFSIFRHVNKIRTVVSYKKDESLLEKDIFPCKGHSIYLRDELYRSTRIFGSKEIVDLKDRSKEIGISKVVIDRLGRAILDYNDCMTDPHLFPYFIELYGSLAKIRTTIIEFQDTCSLQELHDIITDAIDTFEKGFYCRYHQGLRFPDLANFNIEFNSGLQNILTTFNQVYVSYVNLLQKKTEQNNIAFIIVTGDDNISSNAVRLRVNSYHLFHPEFFLMSVIKEAFNGYLSTLTSHEKNELNTNSEEAIYQMSNFIKGTDLSEDFRDYILDFLNKDFIDYMVIDNWIYQYGFNQDFRLYYHWFIANFITTPENYHSQKIPSEKQFVVNYFRLLVILIKNESEAKLIFNEVMGKPYDSMFYKYWKKYLKDFSNLFNKFEPVENESGEIEHITNVYICLFKVLSFSDFFLLKFCKDEVQSRVTYPGERKEIVENLASNYANLFRQGKVVTYKRNLSATRHLTALSIAYLRSLSYYCPENIFDEEYKTKFVLDRERNGDPKFGNHIENMEISKKNYFSYLFDPHGGVYLSTFSARKKYLEQRSLLYFALFDFASKKKIEYFK